MVEAIRQAATAAKPREQFVSEANAARKSMLKTGSGLETVEVHAYLRQRVARKSATVQKARPWQSWAIRLGPARPGTADRLSSPRGSTNRTTDH